MRMIAAGCYKPDAFPVVRIHSTEVNDSMLNGYGLTGYTCTIVIYNVLGDICCFNSWVVR